ncbi:hypothetical protein M434DRAFT_127618 [Hypoxylon sp. CO27-5]|nr:hypothetical protein M434DRAFT_127618 [Hypoxylon sp. CO27-5]
MCLVAIVNALYAFFCTIFRVTLTPFLPPFFFLSMYVITTRFVITSTSKHTNPTLPFHVSTSLFFSLSPPPIFHLPLPLTNHFTTSPMSNSHFYHVFSSTLFVLTSIHQSLIPLGSRELMITLANINSPVLPTCCPRAGLLTLSRLHFILFLTYP